MKQKLAVSVEHNLQERIAEKTNFSDQLLSADRNSFAWLEIDETIDMNASGVI